MRVPSVFCSVVLLMVACGSAGDGSGDSFGGAAVVGGAADGLGVTAAEAAAILRLVNAASFTVLDDDVRLDRRAAENIVAGRPIADLDALDAIPWVGVSAFTKLREYVRAQGLVGEDTRTCLLISEYIEGKTDKNKAVEIWNCGASELPLDDIAVCLIRNDESDCTLATPLTGRSLAAGGTLVMCRNQWGTFQNPMRWISEACELEIGSTAIFSGDDRLALVRDSNGDGEFSVDADEVLDTLGRIGYRPWDSPWNDVRLERCRLEPNDGRSFYETRDWFTTQSWGLDGGQHLGVPPQSATCP